MSPLAAAAVTVAILTLADGARRLARQWGSDLPPFGPGAVAIGLAVSVFLAVTGLAGRAARDFDAGLCVSAIAGTALWLYARRLDRRTAIVPIPPPGTRARFLLAVLAVAAVYTFVAWKYQMHDENPIFGHKSMVEQLRRGEYPMYLPPLPAQDARYHYGFDILAGSLARGYGLSADLSIDLITLLFVIAMCWAAAAVVAEAGAARAAPFAAVAIHFSAGLAWLLLAGVEGRHPRCLTQYHHPSCGSELFPTPFLNVFQHPVSVGVPLFLVFLLLARRVLESKSRAHAFAAAALVVLPALSLGQVVYFSLGCMAVIAFLPFWLFEHRAWRRAGLLAGIILGGAILAYLAGGMLTPSPVNDPHLIVRRRVPGFPPNAGGPGGIVFHHLVNLGAGLVLLPIAGAYAALKRRYVLGVLSAFAAGGMIVPHFWDYVRSWDIVKFPSAAAFALGLIYVIMIDARLAGRPFPLAWLRRAGRAAILGSGVLSAVFVAIPLEKSLQLYDPTPYAQDPLLARAIDWWRANGYRREQLIYVQSNIAQPLAVFGGLSVVGDDYDFAALGIRMEVLDEQRRLRRRIQEDMDPESLRKMGVHWVMFSNEELQNLGAPARAALEDPSGERFELAATIEGETPFRTRRIWRVAGDGG